VKRDEAVKARGYKTVRGQWVFYADQQEGPYFGEGAWGVKMGLLGGVCESVGTSTFGIVRSHV